MSREPRPTLPEDRRDSPQELRVRWFILVLLLAAPFCAYLTRVMSAINTTLRSEYHIDEVAMGSIFGVFNVGYVLFQVPGGWLAQRFSVRAVLACLAIGWSLSTVVFTLSNDERMFYAARIAMGMFQAGMVPCCALVIGAWVKEQYRGVYSSLIGIAMQIGGVVATSFTPYLLMGSLTDALPPMRWSQVYFWYAMSGIVFAGAFYWIYRDHPTLHPWLKGENGAGDRFAPSNETKPVDDDATAVDPTVPTRRYSIVSATIIMLTSATMWMICLQGFFRAFAYEFFTTWFTAYLEQARGMKLETAGNWASLPIVGFGVGSLIGGVAVDYLLVKTGNKWVSRSLTAAVTMGMCALCTWAAVLVRGDASAILLISLGALLASIAGPCTWAACLDVSGKRSALIFGIMNSIGAAGALLCPITVGYLFDYIKTNDSNWDYILYLFVFVNFAGAVSWIALNPNVQIFPENDS